MLHLSHNAVRALPGQCAEDTYVPHRPHPSAAEIAHREHYARCQGWESVADREAVLAHLRVWAARIIAQRADVLQPVSDYAHLLELLEDRVADGTIRLPAQPWKAGAVGDLCKLATRAEWGVERLVRERMATLVPVSDDDDAVVVRWRESQGEDVAGEAVGDDPLVQLVVTTQERVERESAAFAQRQDGFVARVLGVLGVRRAA